MTRLLTVFLAAGALLLGSCAVSTDDDTSSGQTQSAETSQVDDVLATHDLDDLSTVDLVDRLDRLGGKQRPTELMAAVLPDKIVLTAAGAEVSRDLPADRFYLSVAPYANQTHDCFNHSLTTCTGELSDTSVRVKVVEDETGKVLVDEERSTFANGFLGLWLPRDIRATLTITSALGQGSVEISTAADAATCLTTLKLT